ncbi:MAG: leucine-rich repeat domain-containing protein [Mollicutes bacterium]|nr:leucine-rich repeat domain-containing protein [Mollicutes bacterium]
MPEGALGGSNTITNVTLNKTKEIGVGAFKDMTSLTTISLNEGIETINTGAFSGDSNLTSLDILDSVKFIDYQAFSGITLKEFKLPKALETFNYSQDMPNLEKWIISSDAANFIVDDRVLYTKNYTTLVNFPIKKDPTNFVINNLTTEIVTHAFDHTTITNINFDNISKINSYAFFEAKELSKATFSNKLTFIGSSAFSGCINLSEVIFSEASSDNQLLEVENQVFASCSNLASITLPKYLVNIGDSMFANDTKLTTVTILGNIKYLGLLSFSKTGITELEITFDDNANIGSRPFLDTKLEKLTIHFVDNITTYLTINSLGLGVNPNIYVDNEEIKTKLKEAWANLNETTGLIEVKGTISPEFTIEDNVLIQYNKSLSSDPTKIIIPDGVTKINIGVFTKLDEALYIYIPSSVVTIEVEAFSNTSNVLEIELGHDDPTILANETYLYRQLGYKDNSKTIFAIKDSSKIDAFKDQFSMFKTNVTIKNKDDVNLDYDRKELYSNDKSIIYNSNTTSENYSFITEVKTINNNAFKGNKTIKTINWNNVETIGNNAFNSASNITKLGFSDKITSIGISSFAYTPNLTNVKFDGATYISESSFYQSEDEGLSYNITNLDLGNKITGIGDNAFMYACKNVNVFIPDSCDDLTGCSFDYFSNDEESSVYFECSISKYTDDTFLENFLSSCRENYDIVVAFYSSSAPSEADIATGYNFYHYDSNNNKVLY